MDKKDRKVSITINESVMVIFFYIMAFIWFVVSIIELFQGKTLSNNLPIWIAAWSNFIIAEIELNRIIFAKCLREEFDETE